MSRLQSFLDNWLTDGGEVVNLKRRPTFTPRKFHNHVIEHIRVHVKFIQWHSAEGDSVRFRSGCESNMLTINELIPEHTSYYKGAALIFLQHSEVRKQRPAVGIHPFLIPERFHSLSRILSFRQTTNPIKTQKRTLELLYRIETPRACSLIC
jgi:hypothetical protein